MPDRRTHRGARPEDAQLFAPAELPPLRHAAEELSWLLSRGYAEGSALKLVGDRHGLRVRQRQAVSRSACTDEQLESRLARRKTADDLMGRSLWVDAFNVLISLESWLSGAVLVQGRDHALRDLASVHGSYRSVDETDAALGLLACALRGFGPSEITVLFDRPVSNSGQIAARARERLATTGLPCDVSCVPNPDAVLVTIDGIVASADRWVLDRAAAWVDLPSAVIAVRPSPEPWIVDLAGTRSVPRP